MMAGATCVTTNGMPADLNALVFNATLAVPAVPIRVRNRADGATDGRVDNAKSARDVGPKIRRGL
jgi:hypothetical protein